MKNQKLMKVTFVIFLLTFTIIFIALFAFDDNSAPTISYGSDPLTYTEGEDKKDLLKDVIAMDKEEGDVTDSIIIETIQIFPDEEFANVIYVAKDSKNNITKKSRKIYYVKANADSSDVESTSDENGSATDTEDSQSTDNSQSADNSQSTDNSQSADDSQSTDNTQGTDNTQETGDTEDAATTEDTLTTDLDTEEQLVSTGVPIIRLNAHEVKISSGDYFNPMNYIETAVDDKDDIYRRIQIKGDYTTTTPGEYTLEYRASDRDGNISNVEKLVLTVE